jgi:hypothetical protein
MFGLMSNERIAVHTENGFNATDLISHKDSTRNDINAIASKSKFSVCYGLEFNEEDISDSPSHVKLTVFTVETISSIITE